MKETPNYYAIIPADVRYDKDLIPNAKLLYGEITALCNAKGYCWASTEYFAKLYDVNRVSIQRWLRSLEENGYIHREVVYKEGTKEIEKRAITILNNPSNKNVTTPLQKINNPSNKNVTTPPQKSYNPSNKNVTDNNTSNNTINNNDDDDEQAQKTQNIHLFYQQNFGVESPIVQEDLNYWVDDLNEELVIEALKRAAFNNKQYSYAKKIMQGWAKKNITTIEQVKAEDVSFERSHSNYHKKSTPPPRTSNNNIHF